MQNFAGLWIIASSALLILSGVVGWWNLDLAIYLAVLAVFCRVSAGPSE